ncbi:hypothetical protein Hbl1158_08780 [Halobaculum sp. CBA1158]|uniref:hypothetical protein n=1 Tax=Halobaculum sp. CBA1158 TaxID=2904243 RepID=UPI001F34E6A7|nr:hypothetical protein [Halobaculum sp. CBA1158]UIO98650.1 hypothetical protein Hbl1158_08780 [Halobaculum sp. CBA1158]
MFDDGTGEAIPTTFGGARAARIATTAADAGTRCEKPKWRHACEKPKWRHACEKPKRRHAREKPNPSPRAMNGNDSYTDSALVRFSGMCYLIPGSAEVER